MTYKELIKKVYKSCNAGITYNQTRKVMITAVRVVLEECLMHPETATLELTTLGKFFMLKRNYTMPTSFKGFGTKDGYTTVPRWTFRFRQYPKLGKMLNGMIDIRDLTIGGMPLYPDEDIAPNNGRKPVKFTTDQTIDFQIKRRAKQAAKKKEKQKREVSVASRIPDDED